jgi:hypothetical protein
MSKMLADDRVNRRTQQHLASHDSGVSECLWVSGVVS